MLKTKYRIVRDNYTGYEAQVKFWWFPLIWLQVGGCNTYSSLESAVKRCERHRSGDVVKGSF